MDYTSKPSWMLKLLVFLVVIATGGAVAYAQNKKAPEAEGMPTSNPGVTITEIKRKPAAEIAYKDGVYSTTGDYTSPGGPETIDVTLTVEGGVITDAAVVGNAVNPGSVKFQGQFVAGYKEFVIGKSLADLELSKVSGSSLTPKGFNEALVEIRTQAAI